MNRIEFFRKNITKSMRGIEFGPSYSPLFPKKEGFNCMSVDHACKKELIEKYEKWKVPTELIEEVDLIFDGTPLDKILPNNSFDYIVASHVFEHLPDPINFLNSMGRLLTEKGVLLLAIPDKRFCFDLVKPLTSPGLLIDSYLNKKKVHSLGQNVDAILFHCKRNKLNSFPGQTGFKNIKPNESCEKLIREANDQKNQSKFIDIHAWCFTPRSFISNIKILSQMKFIDSLELKDLSNNNFEFFCEFRKINRFRDNTILTQDKYNCGADYFQLWLSAIEEEKKVFFPNIFKFFLSKVIYIFRKIFTITKHIFKLI